MENTMKMYITADEVAELLGVSRGYAYKVTGAVIYETCKIPFAGYGRKFTKYKTRIRKEVGCFGNERFIFKIQNSTHRGRTRTCEKRISGQTRSAGEISVVILP